MNIDDKADDVYTTFFEKVEPEIAQPEKAEAETAEPKKPDVIRIGSSSSERECSSTSELKCSSTSELECSRTLDSELSLYVSSYDESISSDETGYLEKSVPGLMKMTILQKGPSKDLLNWYEGVNDQDEEEIDKDDDETYEQDDEIDEEAEDGKMILMMSYGVQKPLEQLIRNLSVQK
ncbi:hypothetical protein Tco_0509413 [Tanacetum coccineum]